MTLTLDAPERRIPGPTDRSHQTRKRDRPLGNAELQLLRHRRPDEPPDADGESPPTFPNRPWRNRIQESFEVAALVHLLRVPRGGRLLEIGCGRGIGLVPLSHYGQPATLTGLDIEIAPGEIVRVPPESVRHLHPS